MEKDELSIASLRDALRGKRRTQEQDEAARFEAQARRLESALARLTADIRKFLADVPELELTLEDETEEFTSPAFPGRTVAIEDQRLRITAGEDFLLFDPTAAGHFTTLGQVDVRSSRRIPFMMEKALYLMAREDDDAGRSPWGYRSIENLGGGLTPFDRQALLRMLHAVFA